MRLWSIHPDLLDRRALVACWREALLAQKVLAGGTRGYTRHPQLMRFRACDQPSVAIAAYLDGLATAAEQRDYHFNRKLIVEQPVYHAMPVTRGQLAYEWEHLRAKVLVRDPDWLDRLRDEDSSRPHPLFTLIDGPVAEWEIV